jgi:hypothetical protein
VHLSADLGTSAGSSSEKVPDTIGVKWKAIFKVFQKTDISLAIFLKWLSL